jgi:hypothetical protein
MSGRTGITVMIANISIASPNHMANGPVNAQRTMPEIVQAWTKLFTSYLMSGLMDNQPEKKTNENKIG